MTNKVTPIGHIAWLKTFGHVHKDTVKLIQLHKRYIDLLLIMTVYGMNAVPDELRDEITTFIEEYGDDLESLESTIEEMGID